MNKITTEFKTYDDFFSERVFSKFLLFSYVALFLVIIYSLLDYYAYKNTSDLSGGLIARFISIFSIYMVTLIVKLNYFQKKILLIMIFGTLGYCALSFSFILYNIPIFFIIYNWFFYLIAIIMLSPLVTKKLFILVETFQIGIVVVLMFILEKDVEDILLYFFIALSLVIYSYTAINLNRKNSEELYKNAYYMHIAASIDGLSGLLNRKSWDEKAKNIFSLKENISLLMIDIDFFKKVNDTYGHDAGDVVIKRVSDILLEQTKMQDIIGRLGGEEFGVLLINTDLNDTIYIAEKIRYFIEKDIIVHNNNFLNVTVSIGISLKNSHIKSFEEFIKNADLNLYRAKEEGRNKTIL